MKIKKQSSFSFSLFSKFFFLHSYFLISLIFYKKYCYIILIIITKNVAFITFYTGIKLKSKSNIMQSNLKLFRIKNTYFFDNCRRNLKFTKSFIMNVSRKIILGVSLRIFISLRKSPDKSL